MSRARTVNDAPATTRRPPTSTESPLACSTTDQRAGVTGAIALTPGWPVEAHAELRASDLDALAGILRPFVTLPVITGTVTASADVKGQFSQPSTASGVISLAEVDARVSGTPVKIVEAGRLRFDGPHVTVERPLRVRAGDFSLALTSPSRAPAGVVATLEGRIEDALALLPPGVRPDALVAAGPVRAHLSLTSAGDVPALDGSAEATLERLGIGAEVRAKARTQPGGLVGELLASGEAELAIQQLPELLAVPGIEVVGPLPDAVQKINTSTAGVFARSQVGEAAAQLIAFLAGPGAHEVFRAKGFEPAG